MKTLVIGLDGFKYDYLNKAKFLKSFSKESESGSLETLFGFRGILASFFTGKSQEEHGIFTEFKYTNNSTLKNYDNFFFRNLDKVNKNKNKYFLSWITSLTRALNNKTFMGRIPNNLPLHYLRHFDFSMDKNFSEKNSLPVKTIFDLIREKNKKFIFTHYPIIGFNNKTKYDFLGKNKDEFKSKRFLNYLKKDYDFYFLDLSDLDRIAHKFGTRSLEVEDCIKKTDNLIEDLVLNFKGNIMIWSDHGMVDVKKRIDVRDRLKNFPQKYYLCFLDSTMLQFWFFDPNIKSRILKEFENDKDFILVDDKEQKEFEIRFKDNRYGDLIYRAREGVVVEPDYFEGKVQAMHGYDPKLDDMKTFFLVKGQNIENKNTNKNIKDLFHNMKEFI